jgi:hypothetical protein
VATSTGGAIAGLAALLLAAVVLIATVTGCGGGESSHRSGSDPRSAGAFAWLHPAPPPAGWKVARIPGGAAFAYPPGWRPIKTDPGTATEVLVDGRGRIDGYLNSTPKQGPETANNWRRFRPEHNRGEGDMSERVVASSTALKFRSGRGSCVIDDYRTSKAGYREIACLVSSPSSTAVMVAAAPKALWNRRAATLERAVSSFSP